MTMTIKREYSILPQGDKDDFHHHVREGNRGATSQYICLFTVISIVIVFILAGVALLTASVFYSDKLSTTYRHFFYSYESITSNDTNNLNKSDDSSFKEGSKSTSAPHRDSTDYIDQNNKTFDSDHHYHQHHPHDIHHNSSGENSFDNNSIGESDWHGSRNTTGENDTSDQDSDGMDSTLSNSTSDAIINMEKVKENFAKDMRDLEKLMEKITGIRKAEFVIPIFMLICFLTLFSLVSLCCCALMRRRDNRRRKLFGKLITDLQTGDSKTVLLNHSDLDD